MKLNFLILFFCSAFLIGYGQKHSVTIRDRHTNLPVPFAHVCIEKGKFLTHQVTDGSGKINVDIGFPFTVAISGVGYKTSLDTLHNATDTTIYLMPVIFDLDEVVVTGQASAKKSDQSVYKVNVISRQDIDKKAAVNLSTLLNNELNINIARDGILGRTLSIRGLGGEHVKILVDGIPVVGRQNGIIDLDQLNLNNVDHIEIVEGPLSVIYGSNALGGVINIITRRQTATRLSAGINTYYETVGIYNADANFNLAHKNHVFGVHAARNFFSGFDPQDNSRFKLWKPKLQYNPGITWFYSGKKVKLSSSIDYLHEELRDKDSVRFNEVTDRYFFTERMNSSLLSEFTTGVSSKIIFTGGYSYFGRIKNSYAVSSLSKTLVSDAAFHDSSRFSLIYHRGYYAFTGKSVELITGYDLNYEYGFGKRINGIKEIGDVSLYSNVVWSPIPNFKIQPGIRLAYNTKYNAPVVYSLNIGYKPRNFNLRASFGKGFRTPSLKELYLEFIDQNHHVLGNENLKAETANSFILSGSYLYRYGKHNMEFSSDLFYTSIQNKIDFLFNSDNALWAQYYNINDFRSKGAEFSIKYLFHPRFILKTGVIFNGISALSDDPNFTYNTDYTASFNYKNLKYGFQLSTYYKFTGKKTFYKGNFDLNEGVTQITKAFIDDYHNLDIIASAPLLKNRLLVTTGVKNLLNNITVMSTGSLTVHGSGDGSLPVGWGRSYFVKLGYRFIKY
jgi:outer membrane receptor for ferrienterochelin and colicins